MSSSTTYNVKFDYPLSQVRPVGQVRILHVKFDYLQGQVRLPTKSSSTTYWVKFDNPLGQVQQTKVKFVSNLTLGSQVRSPKVKFVKKPFELDLFCPTDVAQKRFDNMQATIYLY